jgi:hypothetical protein
VTPIKDAIDTFNARHPWWSRPEAVQVLRAVRDASANVTEYAYITNLDATSAEALWTSGRPA